MKKFISNSIFLLFSFISIAQVNFTTNLSKEKLGLNERVKVEFSMDKDGDNFIAPSFENFKVVGGPSQSIRTSWVNGKRSYSKSYSYFLSPVKKGVFEIGQAKIEVEGKIYKTLPVKITVTSAIDKPDDPNDPNYIAEKKIHLVAEISNKNPYVNEAISVTYKLFVSRDTGVDNWRELEAPRFKNFWSNDIDISNSNIKDGTYKGQSYRYVVLRKTLLYPQKEGKLKIEPLTLDVSVQVPSNRRDFFGQALSTSVNKTVSSGSSYINVNALPSENKPTDFSGAVGDFKFESTTDKNDIILDEAFQLSLIISGNGNFNLFDFPSLKLPKSLEIYEPEKKEKLSKRISGIKGKLSYKYTIVPNLPGKYMIPKISFTYFNPVKEEYKTIFSDKIYIDVDGIQVKSKEEKSDLTNNFSENKTSKNLFSPFKTKTKFLNLNDELFFNSKFFWVLFLIPFLSSIIIFILKKYINTLKGNNNYSFNKSISIANDLLNRAKKSIGEKKSFYDNLEKSLINFLKAYLDLKNLDFNNENLKIKLIKKGLDKKSIEIIFIIFKNCQMARYTPLDINEMSKDFENIEYIVKILKKINEIN